MLSIKLCITLPHADDHVYIAANPFGVGREQVSLDWLEACVLDNWLHLIQNLIQILRRVDIGNISRVENIVDVL